MVTRMERNSHTEDENNRLKKCEEALVGTRFRQIEHYKEVTSTNDELISRAPEVTENLIFVADYQTHGRGRLKRVWQAPAGENLLCSLLVLPDWEMNRNSLVTSALALSIVGCLYEEGIEAFVKWPNDIVLKEPKKGKLAGILSEYIPGNPEKIVIGFGININWPTKKIKGLEEAVSLKMIGKNFNKWDLLIGVLKNFEKKLQILAEPNGQDILRQEHIAKSETLGTMIQVEMQKNEIRGLTTDITDEGFLLVDDGATVTEITSGDVRKLRNQ